MFCLSFFNTFLTTNWSPAPILSGTSWDYMLTLNFLICQYSILLLCLLPASPRSSAILSLSTILHLLCSYFNAFSISLNFLVFAYDVSHKNFLYKLGLDRYGFFGTDIGSVPIRNQYNLPINSPPEKPCIKFTLPLHSLPIFIVTSFFLVYYT